MQRVEHGALGVRKLLDAPERPGKWIACLHDPRGNTDRRRVGRHILDYHGATTDARAVAERDRPQNLRADADDDIIAQRRMAFPTALACAAQSHILVQDDVIADDRRLADHDTHAVVDEKASADLRAGMNLDAGQEPADLR